MLIVFCVLSFQSCPSKGYIMALFKGFLYVYKPIARVDVDDIAFSSSLFSDKVDNTDGLNQLHMDAFGCMVQGSFLTYRLCT